ncbi:MAG: glycoside hydrolase family 88 protein [Oscillospiraceae bacterium]|nr:glycoside hydrolase family 88 protein [Oscillospiraceae bacterium]
MGYILFFILLFLTVTALAFDAAPLFRRWFGRIKIGWWDGEREWREAVKKVTVKWLLKTPTMPVSDNARLTVIDRARGTYKSKKLQSWQEAALLMALNGCAEEPGVSAAIRTYIGRIIGADGCLKEPVSGADEALRAYAILSSPLAGPDKIKSAMDSVYTFLRKAEKGGTVPYNTAVPNIRFVDTVGMICPFLLKYAAVYGCSDARELAVRQIGEYLAVGMHGDFYIPFHGFDQGTKAPLGICGWGRGCGWLAVGLMESFKTAQDETFKKYLLESAGTFAARLLPLQTQNGAWSRQLFAEEAGESSATAMIGTFMAWLYEASGDEQYRKSAQQAKEFLMSRTRRDGKVDHAQGDTKGIGFYSARLDVMPAAQAFTLALCASIQL